jgi:acyl-CoA thioester hydrolase
MARVKLQLPETFAFQTNIPIRIGDINYGGHMGHDAALPIMQEARVQFLQSLGYASELNIDGRALVVTDAVIIYRSEGFYGDILKVEIAVDDLQQVGCDLLYRLSNANSGKEVIRAKTGIAFVDAAARRMAAIPDSFRARFG